MSNSVKLSHGAFFGGRVTFESLRVAITLAAGGRLSEATGALTMPRTCPPALLAFLRKAEYKGVIVSAEQVGQLASDLQSLLLTIPRPSGTRPGSSYDRTITLIEGCQHAHELGQSLEFK